MTTLFFAARRAFTAGVGAVADFVPDLCPFFSPGERALADRAGFGGEVGFAVLGGHRVHHPILERARKGLHATQY